MFMFYIQMKGQQLKAEVEALFEVVPSRCTADEIVIICPVPGCGDQSGNRGISLQTGMTNCWRCNKGGPFVKWARFLGYEISEDVSSALSVQKTSDLLNQAFEDRHKVLVPVVSSIKLPRGFTPLRKERGSVYYRLIEKMAVKKNLEQWDMVEAGVGFTRDDPYWEPYAIFPIVEWGNTVYYQGRLYRSKPGDVTKKFPSKKFLPLGSKYWVYDIDEVRKQEAETVIVVESILNVLSLKKKIREMGLKRVVPVAVFKHKLSAPQIAKLLACRSVKELCLMFDADATASAWKSAESLINKKKVTVACMPEVEGKRTLDPNDDVELAMEMFEKRRTYTMANKFLEVLNTL